MSARLTMAVVLTCAMTLYLHTHVTVMRGLLFIVTGITALVRHLYGKLYRGDFSIPATLQISMNTLNIRDVNKSVQILKDHTHATAEKTTF